MKKKAAMIMAAALSMAFGMSVQAAEDELVVYTWEGVFPQELLERFEEESGIKVIYTNFDTDETMLEKLSQAEGGDYDVILCDDYIIENVVAEGLAEKLDISSLPNFENINPLYQSQSYDPDNEYTVPFGAGIPLIVYDPEQVDIEITGYKDLWDPSLEDSVAIIGNYRVINGITNLMLGKSMNDENLDSIAQTGEKLLELAPNIRLIQDSDTQNALLNGEASAAFLYTSQVTAALEENPDLEVVYPEEGLGFGIMNLFVPSKAPNREGAYQFLDFLMDAENAAECFEYMRYYSTIQTADALVDESLIVPENVTKGEIVTNISAEADAAYSKNWTEFRAECD
ncbi:MAG: spermidine/putrescine ABC transporter substrate-binding protein [Eubacteriales bacterium]|nr:spermidine/putrescine ABC transporter substrate-binding protein [Eubacteriales bacterium]